MPGVFGLQVLWKGGVTQGILVCVCCMALVWGCFSNPAQAMGEFKEGVFTSEYGSRRYKLYIPSGYQGQAVPLVVMLHGCTQDPADFAAGTKMNTLAEQQPFLVVYPEQPVFANISKCWHWFLPAHQQRGTGEPALIAGMTQTIMTTYQVDPSRVYIAGLSAGGAMTVVMGATYPDLYAAIGVSAGFAYQAARDPLAVLKVAQQGGPDPRQQGTLAYQAAGAAARVVPVIVFHGADDRIVNPVNAEQVLSQWAQTNDLASDDGLDNDNISDTSSCTPAHSTAGYPYTKCVYPDENGEVLMEKWLVYTMGHRWSGGSSAGSYTDPKGPDASEAMIRFFFAHPKM